MSNVTSAAPTEAVTAGGIADDGADDDDDVEGESTAMATAAVTNVSSVMDDATLGGDGNAAGEGPNSVADAGTE